MLRKKDMIENLAEEANMTKKAARDVYELLIGMMTRELAEGGEVDLFGIGRISTKKRRSVYLNRNREQEEKNVTSVVFKTSKTLKDALKENTHE